MQQQKNEQQIETLYDRLQIPIMIGIMYFIFQLPFVNKTLFQYIPSLFLKERHLSIGGYLFKTALFAGTFLFVQHVIQGLSAI